MINHIADIFSQLRPVVYDDSMTLVEFCGRLRATLNEVIDVQNALQTNMDENNAEMVTMRDALATMQSTLMQALQDFDNYATNLNSDFDGFKTDVNAANASFTAIINGWKAQIISQMDNVQENINALTVVSGVGSWTNTPNNFGEVFNDYQNNIASGEYSHAEGKQCEAHGKQSHAGGNDSTAFEDNSFVHGFGLKSGKENQVVFGKYNTLDEEALFIIGNGDNSETTSNPFVVYPDGTINTPSEIISGFGFDFAQITLTGVTVTSTDSSGVSYGQITHDRYGKTYLNYRGWKKFVGVSAGTAIITLKFTKTGAYNYETGGGYPIGNVVMRNVGASFSVENIPVCYDETENRLKNTKTVTLSTVSELLFAFNFSVPVLKAV